MTDSDRYPVVAFDAELLVHLTDKPQLCPSGVAAWEPVSPWDDTFRHGTILRVRRCALTPGHDGDHEPERTLRLRLPNRARTQCGVPVNGQTWIAWAPADGDPLCPACYGLAADGEQEALAI